MYRVLYLLYNLKTNSMTTEGIKVGDKVQFNIGEEVFIDVVTYVDSNTIEGERYDLTHVNLVVIEK